jgi:hypothetical protein
MESVSINGKDYPFIVSASSAKEITELMVRQTYDLKKLKEEDEQDEEKMQKKAVEYSTMKMDLNLMILHKGLIDGRYAQPWFKRLYMIPSRERLERILSTKEAQELIDSQALPKGEKGEEGDLDEKKY